MTSPRSRLRVWNVWSLVLAPISSVGGVDAVEWINADHGFSHAWPGALTGLVALASWTELRIADDQLLITERVLGLRWRTRRAVRLPVRATISSDWEGYPCVWVESEVARGGWVEMQPPVGVARVVRRIDRWLREHARASDR